MASKTSTALTSSHDRRRTQLCSGSFSASKSAMVTAAATATI